ncbi:AT-hook motif nuclear-localized protein 17 [Abeliophyllum distichum]|uniref:AT-hook motif nuclear-localized protein n=1 Tax=Abeliophyllum distichum TaxID=126358 RepID=A0ABD1Q5D4_9LAMI
MKREYAEENQDHSNNKMISKLHQTKKFHQNPQPPFSTPVEESRLSPTHSTPLNLSSNDGDTIEVSRRPRGRPPGSKNKPKPPVIITQNAEPSMTPYVLELPSGVDVIEAITRFCRKRKMGLCVLNGNGAVSNVTLKQPSTTGATVTFHGRFNILSLSATILPVNVPTSLTTALANGIGISLAGPQGQVVGGLVVGPLISAGTIYLISAMFNSPSFHRLPMEDDAMDSASGGEANGGRHQSPPPVVSCADSGHPPAESCGISTYSYQPSDVVWAPTARQSWLDS